MKVNEIKEKLDELGIEYDDKLKKDELLKLLEVHESVENTTEEVPETAEVTNDRKFLVVYHRWKDLEDNNKTYKKNDVFEHEGKSEERIAALSTTNNKIGKILIKEID